MQARSKANITEGTQQIGEAKLASHPLLKFLPFCISRLALQVFTAVWLRNRRF